jgi:hypothetical protein
LPTEGDQSVANDPRGAMLFEGKLGMGVKVVSDIHHGVVGLVEKPGKVIDEGADHSCMVLTTAWPPGTWVG